MEHTDEVTIEQAALLLDRKLAWTRRLVQRGTLAARREGIGNRSTLYISRAAVDALHAQWETQPPKRGRPRKSATHQPKEPTL